MWAVSISIIPHFNFTKLEISCIFPNVELIGQSKLNSWVINTGCYSMSCYTITACNNSSLLNV